ncbi:MAG: 50S ribosomal protein L7/L12, partial [Simkania negevensis]|nr:50S ribosomal protein L7/L12 [Simkania negevensis]
MAKQEVNIEQIVETLSHLTVLDLSNLKKALEEKWGVKAVSGGGMPMMMAAA